MRQNTAHNLQVITDVKQMPESAKHEDRIGFLPFSAKTRGKNTSASKKKPKNNGLFGIGAKKM